MDGALIGLGIFLAGQLIIVLIWGAQMEMRMRAVEQIAKTVGPMRDDMIALKGDVRYIRSTTDQLNEKFDRVMEEDRSFRPRRRTTQESEHG